MSPTAALDVFDFEEAAHRKVRDSHWAYMVSGVDDDATLRANRGGYQHVQLRPRRLRDATKVDIRVELFGNVYDSPIFLCPASAHKAFWPDGEEAVARAAKARGTLQFLSSASSTGVEDVNKALGRPVWYQVYAPSSWEACEQLLERVQAAGCPLIALTVDNTTGRNSETYLRTRPKDLTQCAACHKGEPFTDVHELPMYDGINMNGVTILNPALDWAFADRMRKFWKGKFFINFSPAIADKAGKEIRAEMRSWQLHLRSDKSLEDLSRMFNPKVRGWLQYYGRYYRSALYPIMRQLDRSLARWAYRKYKKLRGHLRRATHWLARIARRDPGVFAHWQMGVRRGSTAGAV